MSLLADQMVLGRCLQSSDMERTIAETAGEFAIDRDRLRELGDLVRGTGFGFTRQVQRSWCMGRTAGAAQLTLSLLTIEQRRSLVEDWVDEGGGAALDVTSDAAAFLAFVAQHLLDPSHELSVCRMEEAAYRASAAAANFLPAVLEFSDEQGTPLRRGRASTLVYFFANPRRLFAAIKAREPLPALGKRGFPYLFAPGLTMLRRVASGAEVRLWHRLAVPASLHALRAEGFSHRLVTAMLAVGAVETARNEFAEPDEESAVDLSATCDNVRAIPEESSLTNPKRGAARPGLAPFPRSSRSWFRERPESAPLHSSSAAMPRSDFTAHSGRSGCGG
jgi:hypothetical protein